MREWKVRDSRQTNIPMTVLHARKIPLVHQIYFSSIIRLSVMYVSFSYFENCLSPSWLYQSLRKTQYTPLGACIFGLVWFFEVGSFLVWRCVGVVLHLPLNSLQLPTSSSGPTGSCHSQLTFSALRSLLLSVAVLMQPEALISLG